MSLPELQPRRQSRAHPMFVRLVPDQHVGHLLRQGGVQLQHTGLHVLCGMGRTRLLRCWWLITSLLVPFSFHFIFIFPLLPFCIACFSSHCAIANVLLAPIYTCSELYHSSCVRATLDTCFRFVAQCAFSILYIHFLCDVLTSRGCCVNALSPENLPCTLCERSPAVVLCGCYYFGQNKDQLHAERRRNRNKTDAVC
jgi:hypothetical protein